MELLDRRSQATEPPLLSAGAGHDKLSFVFPAAGLLRYLLLLALIELFFGLLIAIVPVSGLGLSRSGLIFSWPFLEAPAKLLFPFWPVTIDQPTSTSWPQGLILLVALVGPFAPFAALLQAATHDRWLQTRGSAWIIVPSLLASLTLLGLPALLSNDIYSYIFYGRIAAIYHQNPFLVVPSAFPADPFLPLVYWRNTLSVYGPVWIALSSLVTLLVGGAQATIADSVLGFKALAIAFHLGNCVLLWAILTRLRPQQRVYGLLLYALNPLILIEFAGNAHNDSVMIFFLLLAIWLHLRDWLTLAMVALSLSVLVKFITILLVPAYLIYLLRRTPGLWPRLWLLLRTGLPAVGIAILLFWPFWAGQELLRAITASPGGIDFTNSYAELAHYLLGYALYPLLPSATVSWLSAALVKYTANLFLLGSWLWLTSLLLRRKPPSFDRLLAVWAGQFAAFALCTSWFWPWYIAWFLALAALRGRTALARLGVWLSLGTMSVYVFSHHFESPLYGGRSLFLFTPAILYLVYLRSQSAWIRHARKHISGRP